MHTRRTIERARQVKVKGITTQKNINFDLRSKGKRKLLKTHTLINTASSLSRSMTLIGNNTYASCRALQSGGSLSGRLRFRLNSLPSGLAIYRVHSQDGCGGDGGSGEERVESSGHCYAGMNALVIDLMR